MAEAADASEQALRDALELAGFDADGAAFDAFMMQIGDVDGLLQLKPSDIAKLRKEILDMVPMDERADYQISALAIGRLQALRVYFQFRMMVNDGVPVYVVPAENVLQVFVTALQVETYPPPAPASVPPVFKQQDQWPTMRDYIMQQATYKASVAPRANLRYLLRLPDQEPTELYSDDLILRLGIDAVRDRYWSNNPAGNPTIGEDNRALWNYLLRPILQNTHGWAVANQHDEASDGRAAWVLLLNQLQGKGYSETMKMKFIWQVTRSTFTGQRGTTTWDAHVELFRIAFPALARLNYAQPQDVQVTYFYQSIQAGNDWKAILDRAKPANENNFEAFLAQVQSEAISQGLISLNEKTLNHNRRVRSVNQGRGEQGRGGRGRGIGGGRGGRSGQRNGNNNNKRKNENKNKHNKRKKLPDFTMEELKDVQVALRHYNHEEFAKLSDKQKVKLRTLREADETRSISAIASQPIVAMMVQTRSGKKTSAEESKEETKEEDPQGQPAGTTGGTGRTVSFAFATRRVSAVRTNASEAEGTQGGPHTGAPNVARARTASEAALDDDEGKAPATKKPKPAPNAKVDSEEKEDLVTPPVEEVPVDVVAADSLPVRNTPTVIQGITIGAPLRNLELQLPHRLQRPGAWGMPTGGVIPPDAAQFNGSGTVDRTIGRVVDVLTQVGEHWQFHPDPLLRTRGRLANVLDRIHMPPPGPTTRANLNRSTDTRVRWLASNSPLTLEEWQRERFNDLDTIYERPDGLFPPTVHPDPAVHAYRLAVDRDDAFHRQRTEPPMDLDIPYQRRPHETTLSEIGVYLEYPPNANHNERAAMDRQNLQRDRRLISWINRIEDLNVGRRTLSTYMMRMDWRRLRNALNEHTASAARWGTLDREYQVRRVHLLTFAHLVEEVLQGGTYASVVHRVRRLRDLNDLDRLRDRSEDAP